ncbi:hypothetical protein CNR22_18895 [Sphingobacteriaceae bacterium]|nr:hypothetical protein CNR22_18895 [Sphingobacteriaceae bacterium]
MKNFKIITRMKLPTRLLFCFSLAMAFNTATKAQEISIDGEFRLNPLYSMGFRKPHYAGDKPSFFNLQRTRIIFGFKKENDLDAEIIIQDRRFWGDQSDRDDLPNIALYRGWVEKHFTPSFSVRAGRQGFVYDSEYLLSDPNWVGTRAHDAGLLKFEKFSFKSHLGFAFNANGQDLKREPYIYKFYKNMQFLWLHQDFTKAKVSFIFLNHGMEKGDTTTNIYYTQTFGPDLSFEISKRFSFKGLFYYQMGKNTSKKEVSAYFYSANLTYKMTKFLDLTLGLDVGSGTSQNHQKDASYTKSQTFDRLYGSPHAHFGQLDYFYVNTPTLCGIRDMYLKTKLKITSKLSLENDVHYFETDAKINDTKNKDITLPSYLGTENDFSLHYKVSSTIKASLGHCIMFGTPTLDAFFGGKVSKQKQYVYAVVTISPTFFKSKKSENQPNVKIDIQK